MRYHICSHTVEAVRQEGQLPVLLSAQDQRRERQTLLAGMRKVNEERKSEEVMRSLFANPCATKAADRGTVQQQLQGGLNQTAGRTADKYIRKFCEDGEDG